MEETKIQLYIIGKRQVNRPLGRPRNKWDEIIIIGITEV
jgi:hypothetical protein